MRMRETRWQHERRKMKAKLEAEGIIPVESGSGKVIVIPMEQVIVPVEIPPPGQDSTAPRVHAPTSQNPARW